MTQIVPSETLSLLTRLSQKAGVQSTLVLARDTGAIVHTSGFTSTSAAANPNTTLPAPAENAANGTAAATAPPLTNGKQETGMRSAEDVARMVHSFVEAAGELVKNLEEEDEVKLLRLRTKKNELVIVPDPRFMIVVVHDTPPTP
ncbi:Dynein light chain-related protein [Lasiodiplodia theobromae]|uniref:Dynein light chain roadblock-type 1 n=2 Tax=Lasiodiplodia TaxID=66739 RepID=A0A5N5DNS0_9PEZI|nr:Dynein light chain roadblock-type 1 [Lasiodiplodia theobromae]KAF9639613.1 Dynein light chain-related protein [Lasiodiplodia theobromae]KAK0640206.1 Dynein light chain roadblock-type 1 [Lasiodiplodia hormozganensis]